MPYLVCESCDIYYEIPDKDEMSELSNCDCGNPLKYYDSLEEYLYQKGKIKKPPKQDKIIGGLIDSYESTIAKIVLYSVKNMPTPMSISKNIKVLRGSKSAFIIDNNFDKLPTYSIFYYFSRKKLNRFIKSLIQQRLLRTSYVAQYEHTPVISLTDKGNELLQNDELIKLDVIYKKNIDPVEEVDKELYEKLRKLRNEIARKHDFSAYIICANQPLMEMASQIPTDHDSMISIKGIGKSFMEKYGEQFLSVIQDYVRDKSSFTDLKEDNMVIEPNKPIKKDSDPFDFPDILLNDPNGTNRAHVAYLLGESRDPQYLDALREATKDKNGNVRRLSAAALGKIGDKKAEDELIVLLNDSTSGARAYAATALGKIKSVKALIPLKRLRSDPIQYVKDAAEEAISKINEVER